MITGGLSNPGKMPGKAYSLPPTACRIGSMLAKCSGTVCSKCYARAGRYRFSTVQNALNRRLQSLTHPQWEDAMVELIASLPCPFFRWHDCGDVQNMQHLHSICSIARRTPDTHYWLPTKEIGLLRTFLKSESVLPDNLRVMYSNAFIDCFDKPSDLPESVGLSSVYSSGKPTANSMLRCPGEVPGQPSSCGSCRACWDRNVPHVAFSLH